MSQCLSSNMLKLIAGAGVGALAMYIFDPSQGTRRRRDLSNAANRALQQATDTVAQSWDGISERARHIGDHISSHAHDVADHAVNYSAQAGDLTAKAARWAGNAASQVPAALDDARHAVMESSDQHLRQLHDLKGRGRRYAGQASDAVRYYGQQLRSYGKGLRDYGASLWETPSESGGSVTGYTLTAAGALVLGLGSMYLFDSTEGRARRQMVVGAVSDAVCQTGQAFRSTGNYLRNQLNHLAHDFGGKSRMSQPSDQGRVPSTHLSTTETPTSMRFPTSARLGLGIAGGTLGFYGATRRDWLGLGIGLLGLGLVAGGLTKYDYGRLGKKLAINNERHTEEPEIHEESQASWPTPRPIDAGELNQSNPTGETLHQRV